MTFNLEECMNHPDICHHRDVRVCGDELMSWKECIATGFPVGRGKQMQIKLINKDTDGEQVHTVVNFFQQMCQACPHANSKH